jgi:hypothetical protein
MKPITTSRFLSQERSVCDGHGAVISANGFCAASGLPRAHFFNFSPVSIIRKFPAALNPPAGLRNASNKLHRHRMSPARTSASRREPPAGRKRFHRSEFIGLERSRQCKLSG